MSLAAILIVATIRMSATTPIATIRNHVQFVTMWLVPGIDATLRKLLIAMCVVLFVVWLVVLLGGGSPSLP